MTNTRCRTGHYLWDIQGWAKLTQGHEIFWPHWYGFEIVMFKTHKILVYSLHLFQLKAVNFV